MSVGLVMLPESPVLRAQLLQFANGIRQPTQHAVPTDVDADRLTVYRELFTNNLVNLLKGMFPVLCSLHTQAAWRKRVLDFYAQHACHTPYFPCIGEEFVAWWQQSVVLPDGQPFLAELAHYEQSELALSIAELDRPWPPVDALVSDAVLTTVPRVSPLCWPLHYTHAVHRMTVHSHAVMAEPTWLLLYRDDQDAVRVVESNPASIQLFMALQNNDMADEADCLTGEQALLSLSQQWQQPDATAVLTFGREILLTWQQQGIIALVAQAARE